MRFSDILEDTGLLAGLPSAQHKLAWVIIHGGGLFRRDLSVRWGVA